MSYVLVSLGSLLVATALAWRATKQAKTRRSVRSALAHGSPAVRRSAIEALGVQGLGPYAADLRELASWEDDASVLEALAEAVNRSQWETNVSRDLFQLRMWAAAHRSAPLEIAPAERPPRSLHLFGREDEFTDRSDLDAPYDRAEVVSVDELRERRQRWA